MKKARSTRARILLAIIFAIIFRATAFAGDWSGVVVHHSATKTGNADVFRRYHIEHNGWDDIGYHFVILNDGTVERGRAIDKAGAHALGRNKTHIGICLVGEDKFTKTQLNSLTDLLETLISVFDIEPKSVEPHHEECPGDGIDLDEIKKEVE